MTTSHRLSKEEKIRKKRDFLRFGNTEGGGARVYGEEFILRALSNDFGFCRLGISVGKKIGKAHIRNRIKRLIREVFRLNKERFPESADILVIVRKKPLILSFRPLEESILGLALELDAKMKTAGRTKT